MKLTRVDTKKLKQLVAAIIKKVEEANSDAADLMALLTDKERAGIPRVRSDFPDAARELAEASATHPEIVSLVEYDAKAVVEDLDNVDALKPLDAPIARLTQMVSDSRLVWLAEAYVPSLEFYGVAKVRAQKDAQLAQTILPLAEVFATPRKKKGEPTGK